MKKTLQISMVCLLFLGIVCSFLTDTWPVMEFITPILLWSAAFLFVLMVITTEVKSQGQRKANAEQAIACADGSALSAGSKEIIALLTEQAEKLATLQRNAPDSVLSRKLGTVHKALHDVLDFLSHEPGTAGKLRSMAKHYLPDFLEAITFYGRTRDHGVVDSDKYDRYIDTMTDSLANVYQQLCGHKDLTIEVNMEVSEQLLTATGILEQR